MSTSLEMCRMAAETEVVAKAARRRFTAAEKLRVLREADVDLSYCLATMADRGCWVDAMNANVFYLVEAYFKWKHSFNNNPGEWRPSDCDKCGWTRR